MNNKILTKTSIFSASEKDVFERLKVLKTLQYIAAPYATFNPIDNNNNLIWKKGEEFSFNFKLFGIIPFGIHKIKVIDFNEESNIIYTNESNPHVPIWNHRILLNRINENTVQYTDEVEINAGWKTMFVYLWASLFYAHRQRKWKKLLINNIK